MVLPKLDLDIPIDNYMALIKRLMLVATITNR